MSSLFKTEHEIEQAEEHLRRLRQRRQQEIVQQWQQSWSQEPPDPEQLIQGYPWPSSRLTRADMIRLTELRRTTRKPITKLLHEAVTALYELLAANRNLEIVPWHGEGRSLWYVVDADAGSDEQPCVVATAGSIEMAQAILRSLTNGEDSSPGTPG